MICSPDNPYIVGDKRSVAYYSVELQSAILSDIDAVSHLHSVRCPEPRSGTDVKVIADMDIGAHGHPSVEPLTSFHVAAPLLAAGQTSSYQSSIASRAASAQLPIG